MESMSKELKDAVDESYNRMSGSSSTCVCPKCGHKQEHQPGVPCNRERCEKCNNRMIRD